MRSKVLIALIVIWFMFTGIIFAQESIDNSVEDNSVSEPIKIERADGTNIIITGDGDNVIHYNSSPTQNGTNAEEIQAQFQVIIKERESGFVLIIPNAKYVSQDELSTEVDEVILELAKNQRWDLIWAE